MIFNSILDNYQLHHKIVESVILLIGNIVCEHPELKKAIFQSQIFLTIKSIHAMNLDNIDLQRKFVFLFSNLVYIKQDFVDESLINYCTEQLLNYLSSSDQEILSDCLWGLSNVTLSRYEQSCSLIFENIISNHIIERDFQNNLELIIPFIRICGNLFSISNLFTQGFLNNRILEKIDLFLKLNNKQVKKESIWSLSIISCSEKPVIMKFIDNTSIINSIISLCYNNSKEVRYDAISIMVNISRLSDYQMNLKLSDFKIVELFLHILKENYDKSVIINALLGLENIIRQGENLECKNEDNPFLKIFKCNKGEILIRNLSKSNYESQCIIDLCNKILYF